MSVSRLIIGIVFLALGAVFLRGRSRLRVSPLRDSGRAPVFVTVLAWIYVVIGLLWVGLAFA